MGVSKRKTSKRKTRGKKRSRLSSSARGAYDYAMSNPGNVAGGALGLAGLGVGLGEGYYALRRGLRTSDASPQYLSPTARAIRGVRGYNYRGAGSGLLDRIMPSRIKKRQQKIAEAEAMRQRNAIYGAGRRKSIGYDPDVESKKAIAAFTGQGRPGPTNKLELGRRNYAERMKNYRARQDLEANMKRSPEDYNYSPGGAVMIFGKKKYGKRRKRRRRKKRSFGKKVKKPSAATKRMCKKLKVRLTVKRGKKRVYKSEKVLKKQCKTAMKRKKKKSKK